MKGMIKKITNPASSGSETKKVEVEAVKKVLIPVPLGDKYLYAVGRRKCAVAEVRIYPKGKGLIYVNGEELKQAVPQEAAQRTILEPLVLTNQKDIVNVSAYVKGGGYSAQSGAIRHGISRALLLLDVEYRSTLKKMGFLMRDPREKERMKCGLKKARRAPQWSKR